ncbi:heavy metal translocating P-type ATPase [Francisella sp. 19X1-34]|uniref:heavy metal translocating P-type ATPase n=1 Tax=Francisella sp. 19X1-34 TaxID=3087177 RepID=UPI002E316C69|nr:heavy metal translocating P-type ATPase [Francisella sp. 19X1-34]MED7789416.1 heavy metal translocating P-type ATPase [Francisella sp. 19X1-34]
MWFIVESMSCSSCVAKIEKALLSIQGVSNVKANIVDKSVSVETDQSLLNIIQNKLEEIGYPGELQQQEKNNHKYCIFIEGISCSGCVAKIEKSLKVVYGVEKVSANVVDKILQIEGSMDITEIFAVLEKIGKPGVLEKKSQIRDVDRAKKEIKTSIKQAVIAFVVGVILMAIQMHSESQDSVLYFSSDLSNIERLLIWLVLAIVTLAVMVYSGKRYYQGAWRQLKHLSSNMDTLVALGTGAAWTYSIIVILFEFYLPEQMLHVFLDTSVLILGFLNIGHAMEIKSKGRASEAIEKLIHLQPKNAHVIHGDREVDIPLELLKVGQTIVIYPGEKIPVDGVVIDGKANVDESMLTGESDFVNKKIDDKVFAGTINQNGSLKAKMTKSIDETALANVIELIKSAQSSKPEITRIVDKVTAVFVPVVITIAVLTFIVWSFFSLPLAVTAGIAVLVVACPCALGLGTPMSMMVGMGKVAEYGILIRNGEVLQNASNLTHIIMDKTGTITQGKPAVTNSHFIADEDLVLSYLYAVEAKSEHPLALALSAYSREYNKNLVASDFEATSGKGISAEVEGASVLIGNMKLMSENGISIDSNVEQVLDGYANQGATPVIFAMNNNIAAIFAVKDPVKKESKEVVSQLTKSGLKVAMVTGDNKHTANVIAQEVGIDNNMVFASAMPEDKTKFVDDLQKQGFQVGMVGDGINDAAALAKADVGFAMGNGTDIAIESADITLTSGELKNINNSIIFSKKIILNIKHTLAGAFIYNICGIPIAAGVLYPFFGIMLSPVIASLAMAMSSVTVVAVALRLKRLKVE